MKHQKKVSHVGYWRAQHEANEAAVLFFTEMTATELMDMKIDMGKEWLIKHLQMAGLPVTYVAELWMSEKVQRWWNLNWRQYDHYYVLPYLHKVTDGERRNVYRDMHLNVFSPEHPQFTALHNQLIGVLDILTEDEPKEVCDEPA